MRTAEPIETVTSESWPATSPVVSVVVATHERAGFLTELHHALAGQVGAPAFEVVVADDGSRDGTWATLERLAATTSLALKAVRLAGFGGAAVPRNTAVANSRGDLIAVTDDDCLPTAGWLQAIGDAFADPAVTVVQGQIEPEPDIWQGPWSRTLEVRRVTGLWECANLACRRDAFEQVGGFTTRRVVPGRPFGEDTQLGAALARRGLARYAAEAVVHHRVLPGRYRDFLEERRRLGGFPALVGEVPELRDGFPLGVFLSRRTLAVDVAVAGALIALAARSPRPAVAALPWLRRCWSAAAGRPGRPRAVRAAQVAVADLVGLGALATGSARARRIVL
jgi:glycosyltransferase involved in cell wall biosynthesis